MASSSSSPEISAASATRHSPDHSRYSSIEEVLEDLSSRFILNLPDEELASLERVCFQVEQAHWFYEDFIREENPKFPTLALKKFSALLFQACPLLRQWSHDHEQAFNNFMNYKTRVPVCGAIMLNDSWDKCILVKGWKSSSGWGFPKGKINQDEEPHKCAIREVSEETGYDLSGQIDPSGVIELTIREQKISLYIVPGVPEDYPFKTRTRKEISRIEWFRLTDLPTWKRNKTVPGKFYLISPFIGHLKSYINMHRPRNPGRRSARPQPIDSSSRTEDGVDLTLDLHTHIGVAHTHSAQESSSSSSADNGGLDTPSPQWSEPVATQVVVDENSGASMDPDLARLLTALSLSAQNGVTSGSEQPTSILKVSAEATSSTPVPASTSTDSRSLPPSSTLKDILQPPPQSSSKAQDVNAPSCSGDDSVLSHARSSGHQMADSASNRSSSRSDDVISASSPSPTSPTTSTVPAGSPQSTASLKPGIPRRGSSAAADISPYLSRPSEIPSSGKRLKQLALLETVADESARMTPVLMHRTLAVPGDATNGRMSVAPISPISMQSHARPLHGPYPGMRDPRVLYSSGSNAQTPSSFTPTPTLHVQRVSPFHPAVPYDPFKVRAQTSMSFHPPPPSHPYRASGRSSMHEKQLLAALNGPVNGANGHHAQLLPHVPSIRSAYSPYPSTLTGPPSQPRVNHLPQSMSPQPLIPASVSSTSTSMSPFDMMGVAAPRSSAHHDNSQLLSILNSHDPIRVEPSTAPVRPPGVLHTIGNR